MGKRECGRLHFAILNRGSEASLFEQRHKGGKPRGDLGEAFQDKGKEPNLGEWLVCSRGSQEGQHNWS